MDFTDYRLPDGRIVPVDSTAAKDADVIGFTLKGGQVVPATRVRLVAMVRHRFTVWIDVPAVSGDGWSQYPDYSAEETGRRLRRALADYGGLDIAEAVVEHADTTEVKK